MSKLILRNWQSPGDVLMLTAAVRDLHRGHAGRFVTDVRTPCEALWQNNPYLTSLHDGEAEQINCEYPLIHQSNNGPWHFIQAFHQFLSERLGIDIRPTEFKGDVHLSQIEKSWMSQVQEITKLPVPFWIVTAGGKFDFTAKWWDIARMQEVIDHFRHKILFVQVGEENHHHPPLRGVLDLRGKTDLRQFVRLMHHAHGVLCPVTFPMHLAAAVETLATVPKNRPCVVVAGGREPTQWEAYPHHQFINTNGALRCCDQGGCWKSRVVPLGDGEPHDELRNLCVDVVHLRDKALNFQRKPSDPVPVHARPDAPGRKPEDFLPRCLDLISAEEVIRRIELYFAGGAARFLNDSEWAACQQKLPSLGWDAPGRSVTSGIAFGADSRRLKNYVELNLATRKAEPCAINWTALSESPNLTPANASEIAAEAIKRIPAYPASYEGRGVLICGGGLKYFTNAWVCINMLRRLGSRLPIEIWHLGPREIDEKMKGLVSDYDVQCIDAYELREKSPCRILNGWELKAYAITHSRFREVFLIDADNLPLVLPEILFEFPEYKEHGAVFWPDRGRLGPERDIWRIAGVEFRDEPEFETGQVLVHKERCWKPLMLALWYNANSDFYYRYIHGDKETFHLAFRKLHQPYAMPNYGVVPLTATMCQHDFSGNRIFQHRGLDKWEFFSENRHVEGFLYEDDCRGFIAELRRKWDGKIDYRQWSEKAKSIASRLINQTHVYHRIGYDSRDMSFGMDGTIMIGAANCERHWDLKEDKDGSVRLQIMGSTALTCELIADMDDVWRGEWLDYERMPIELRRKTELAKN